MYKTIFLTLTFIFSSLVTLGQGPPPPAPPPPAPLIYSAPEKNTLKKFVSETDNFSVNFAGAVRRETLGEDSEIVARSYQTLRGGSNTGVLVITFKEPIKQSEYDSVFELVKQNFIQTVDFKQEYEKKIVQNEIDAFELGYTENNKYAKSRYFIISNKVYVMFINVSNWNVLKSGHPEKVNEFEKEAVRFFNSFKQLPTNNGFSGGDAPKLVSPKPIATPPKRLNTPTVIGNSSKNPPPPPPPPPPPLIYKAPTADLIKQFKSDSLDFSIEFAGSPKKLSEKDGEVNKYVFESKFVGSKESVEIRVFPIDLLEKNDVKKISAYLKTGYLQNVDHEIVSEKEFEENGIKGIEFGLKKYIEFEKIKVYIIENRIYELKIDVTNWGILERHHKDIVAEFESEAKRFFDSFKVNKELISKKFTEDVKDSKFELKIPDKPVETYSLRTDIYKNIEAGFSVKLPKKPEKTVKTVSIGFGDTDYHSFSALMNYGFYGITYFDVPTNPETLEDKEVLYYEQLSGVLKQANLVKVSENIAFLDNQMGIEFVLTNGQERLNLVMVFVGNRFFRMIFAHKDFDKNLSDRRRKQAERNFNSLKREFFDSFKALKTPTATLQQNDLPKDFNVSLESNLLNIGFFNFSIILPPDIYYLDGEGNEEFKSSLQADLEKKEELVKKIDQHSIKNTKIIFNGFNYADDKETILSSLLIAAEKPIFPNFKPKDSIKWLMENRVEEGEKTISGIEVITFDSVEFAWYESYFEKEDFKQRFYIANIDGLSLQIAITYKNDAELKKMLESLNSITFNKTTTKQNVLN